VWSYFIQLIITQERICSVAYELLFICSKVAHTRTDMYITWFAVSVCVCACVCECESVNVACDIHKYDQTARLCNSANRMCVSVYVCLRKQLLQKGDKGVEASIFHIASRFLKENKNAIKKGGRTNTTDDGEEDDDVAAELLRKIIPRASSETTPNNLSHSSTILLQNLIRKCLRFDPKDRPCASLLAEYVLRIENQGAGELHQGPSSPSPSRSKYGVAAKPSAAAMVEAAMAATRAASMSGANEGNATKDGVDDGGASQQSSTESKTREYDLYRLLGQDDFHK